MAHAGGFAQMGSPPDIKNTWEWTIGEIINSQPDGYAYADLAYFSDILGASDDKITALSKDMVALRKQVPKIGDRFLYGTDWSMTGQLAGFYLSKPYHEILGEFLEKCEFSQTEIENIFYHNAVRFLGLGTADQANGTRQRLEQYYAANHGDAGWLSQLS